MGTGLYYLRARNYEAGTGRFASRDPVCGDAANPLSLHKYLYAHADPVNRVDPTGMFICLPSMEAWGDAVHDEIGKHFRAQNPSNRFYNQTTNTILGATVEGGQSKPDLAERAGLVGLVWEIKSVWSAPHAWSDLAFYLAILNTQDPQKRLGFPGFFGTYSPPPLVSLGGGMEAIVFPPMLGAILYCVQDMRGNAATLMTLMMIHALRLQQLQAQAALAIMVRH